MLAFNACCTDERVTYQTANHSTQVEDHPEPGNVAALGLLGRVGHHDGALGTPEQTGAHTEKRASKGSEAQVLGVIVAQIGSHINRVANATEREGSADTELVGEGAGEETNDSEGRV